LVEQRFESATVLQAGLQPGHQIRGHIHAPAPALFREGENEGGMLLASGAGGARRANTGFTDLGQGAFESGPEALDIVKELLAQPLFGRFACSHVVCISYNIHTRKQKNGKKQPGVKPGIAAMTDPLHGI
jgi:hypothetical protein